jgi:hypothetical protein
MQAAEALIAGGGCTMAIVLQMGEELANQLGRQIDDRQAVDGLLETIYRVGQKQRQHIAVASPGIDRKIALPRQILE